MIRGLVNNELDSLCKTVVIDQFEVLYLTWIWRGLEE